MAHYRDALPSQQGWLHELARFEVLPGAERVLGSDGVTDPQQLVEESAIQFLTELRQHITEYTKVFNSYSESGKRFQDVKLYSVAQSAADFMVFRNQIKLTVANVAHGVIQFSFSKHSPDNLSANNQTVQEITAQLGPFREVLWMFKGEKVSPEQVAKFYFAEFVRFTRETRKKLGNQVLLEEIKSLLQEKGFDF